MTRCPNCEAEIEGLFGTTTNLNPLNKSFHDDNGAFEIEVEGHCPICNGMIRLFASAPIQLKNEDNNVR